MPFTDLHTALLLPLRVGRCGGGVSSSSPGFLGRHGTGNLGIVLLQALVVVVVAVVVVVGSPTKAVKHIQKRQRPSGRLFFHGRWSWLYHMLLPGKMWFGE